MWILECAQIRINWFDTYVEHMAEAEFETDSSVRGYHVCQDNWTPVIGELLNCWFSEPEGLGSGGPRFSTLKYFNNAM